MKKKVLLFTLLAFFVVLMAAPLIRSRPEGDSSQSDPDERIVESGSVSVGFPAPMFTLPDISDIPIKLDDFLGKVVIVNFWATWCVPCREEMPVLDDFGLQYSDSVIILGIAVKDTPESVRDFVEETEVSYPILIDETGVVGTAYHVVGYPTTYFIDAAGIIRGKYIGMMTPRIVLQNLTPLGNIK